ncbi:MAG TPA: tripartite tricarboxylate transporter substrate binding protein [Bordetella sp.]|nr:tripartite tricarboxylate transporter substrate binding protein [Bordetella sp.]
MDLSKRQLAAFAVLGSILPMGVMASHSKSTYPRRPITLVIGYPPGGATDTLARSLAEHLAEDLKEKVLIENKPGAAGNIAAESVARAVPDGYTLFIGTRSNTIHKDMYGHFEFDMIRDFAPVSLLAKMPNVIVTGAQAPITTIGDIIALAKAHPGILTYASTGVGSDTHLLGEMFQRETQTKLLHVPYRGGGPALVDVIGGRVDLLVSSLATTLPYIKAGSIRAIAVMSQQRAPAANNIPTMEESGVLGVDLETWFGFVAPAGTPAQLVARLNESVNKVLMNSDLQTAYMAQGYVAPLRPNTPETFGCLIAEEAERWAAIIRERNIKPA